MSKDKYLDMRSIKKYAKELRREVTKSEKQLWKQLRNRKLGRCKFLSQHLDIYKADFKGLNYFVADFYCDSKKLVIELAGSIHDEPKEYDQFRDEEMRFKGLYVLRLKNDELSNMANVSEKIRSYLESII